MRIDTQKQTLSARDESIKKLLEMLQTKGEGKEEEARVHQQMQMVAQKQVRDQIRAGFKNHTPQILYKLLLALKSIPHSFLLSLFFHASPNFKRSI